MIAPGLDVTRPGLADQWSDEQLSPKLKLILMWAGAWCQERGGVLWMTSIWRSVKEEFDIQRMILERQGMAEPERSLCARRLADSSLHPRWRAIDIRIPLLIGASIADLMEEAAEKYPYDPLRPRLRPCIRHIGTGDHLHWQAMASGPTV